MFGNVDYAGIAFSGTWTTNGGASIAIYFRANSGPATVKLNNVTINFPTGMITYQQVPGNYDSFTVVSGTVDYFVVA